jgi:hypothetical protein
MGLGVSIFLIAVGAILGMFVALHGYALWTIRNIDNEKSGQVVPVATSRRSLRNRVPVLARASTSDPGAS